MSAPADPVKSRRLIDRNAGVTGGGRWIAAGRLKPIEPKVLFYMIWATTQQYANAAHEMASLNGGRPLDEAAFERAKRQVIETILGGVAP